MRGSFSVEYKCPGRPGDICAVDWNHWLKNRWRRASKEMYTIRWDEEGRIDQLSYEAILQKFWLQDLKDELPMAVVEAMSPSELMRYREAKGLPRLDVMSDTAGDHRSAEEY